ncbi:MAG TPA: TIM-barrel domain-containing protein [Dinghuibacter sp.]|uniref:TIM-barrel domain-containing protein n=1 Tax=Dinghuibacter sp. TaxID=2024697 RepID=UPI002B8C6241|nr:TIM-barrel domain-containing protein [Dinghuibacter sp.]HTJ13659.1 TIM-barrel domain-containing protein [Dinghuibacter sp.]
MIRSIAFFLTLVCVSTLSAQIAPGKSWPDADGNHIQAHGGGILKVGDVYYWYGEQRSRGLDTAKRFVSCYRSGDLMHWTFLGNALTLDDPERLGAYWVLERPKVYYNAPTKKYVMYFHLDDRSYKLARVGIATSDRPEGPFAYVKSFRPLGHESRDIGQFIDDDGTAYLVFEDRPFGFRIARLNAADYLSIDKEMCLIPEHMEGGAIVHYGGLYYAIGSALTGWNPNPNKYATATSLEGPWSAFHDIAPPESRTYGAQSTMMLKVAGSRDTTVVFMGDIWKPRTQWESGYLWMPVRIGGGRLSVPAPRPWKIDVHTGDWAYAEDSLTQIPSGVRVTVKGITNEIRFYSPSIVRVVKYERWAPAAGLSVVKRPDSVAVRVAVDGDRVTLRSDSLMVMMDLRTGRVSFRSATVELLTEKEWGTQFSPNPDGSQLVRQAFLLDRNEPIYGLGQQQNGRLDQRGTRVRLAQENMKICLPFFQSIKGYGLFWDNESATEFTDNRQETAFESSVAEGADYYFMYGGSADGVVRQLRDLTGQSPLFPLWAFGFLQSRERYKTQFELTDVVRRYRDLKVPLDGIIQDWQYWGTDSNWNAMRFDPVRFPRPKAMVDTVHDLHAHLFVVAWPGFGPLTPQYAEFKSKHMLLDFDVYPSNTGVRPYDVYNPQARDIYWRYLDSGVFSLGVDAWWLDSSEPDHTNVSEKDFDLHTNLGTYRSVQNAFPLAHISGVYDHQRATTSAKRVVILTRSAFMGQQRYGSCNWSGDVVSDWKVLRTQIPAGLNLSLSGIPYWNTDIGGFFANAFVAGGGAHNPAFQELYTRWLQFATFTPMMRSHGTAIPREIYQFGAPGDSIYDIQKRFIELRYSLLPYLYSTAWRVTSAGGSFMRALYMDFPSDTLVYDIDNEYMFGHSLLVCPVTDKGAAVQPVYLPAGADWVDFWTGIVVRGGTTVMRATPLGIIPLYVRAGTILPWGPAVQYASERKWDDLGVRVYPGADASFTLYEDEGDSYDYEQGKYSTIDFTWDERSRTLTVSDRRGAFPGMPASRRFTVTVGSTMRVISYKGKKISIRL